MTPRGAARRRLTKAGFGAAGVLWTTKSHATMSTMMCASASAALSGGLDSNYAQGITEACAGRSPGYWKNHGGWPCERDRAFATVFPCSGKSDNTYGGATMEQLIRGAKFDQHKLGMHLVATYLNVMSGKIGFLSVRTLVQMWGELQTMGYYQPAKGVYWGPEETKRYLEGTHN